MRSPLIGYFLIICFYLAPKPEAWAQLSAESKSSSVPVEVRIERVDLPGVTITQDHLGFMWFGGHHGLYRYDGSQFRLYHQNTADRSSLSLNRIEALHVDREGTLWVGTFGGGLNRYKPETDNFTHFRRDPNNSLSLSQDTVTVILEDRHGQLWVGTHHGLNRFDRKTGTFTRFQHDPNNSNSLSCDQVRVLYEDRQGTLWVGTGSLDPRETPPGEGGLNRFNPESGSFSRFMHDPEDPVTLPQNQIMSLLMDRRGVFWIGTTKGVSIMDQHDGTFNLFAAAATERYPGGFDGGVKFLHEDRAGILWIGWWGRGIERFDPTTGQRKLYHKRNTGLTNDGVWSVFESHEGTLWIGDIDFTHTLNSSPDVFRHHLPEPEVTGSDGHQVKAIGEDREGQIVIGTVKGMYRWDRSTDTFRFVQPDSSNRSGLSPGRIETFYKDREGVFWAGAENNVLNRHNHDSNSFTRFIPNQKYPPGLRISRILEDRKGNFWVGLLGSGLTRFDRATGSFTHHYYSNDTPGSLSHNEISALFEDRDGTLWIGTYGGGLNKFVPVHDRDYSSGTFTTYLSGSIISAIYEDSRGIFWVATWGDGLHRFDRATGTSVRYGKAQGFPTEKLAAILEDNDGHLWIPTSEGGAFIPSDGKLSRFDPEAETVATFDTIDGLPDISFWFGCTWKSSDGTLFFGGFPGFIRFHPDALKDSKIGSPKLVLTGLHVFNEEIDAGEDSPIKEPIFLADEIRLSHSENDFTIDYKALSFHGHGRTQFYYRLDPHDAEWINARGQESARYSGLVPGTYIFRVRAVDGMGNPSNEASILVSIHPPWWRTLWAYLLFGGLIVGAVVTVDRFRRRTIIQRERQQAEIREARLRTEALEADNRRKNVELEKALELEVLNKQLVEQQQRLLELDEMKTRFFTNISHEFRTPLTLILSPLKDALTNRTDSGYLQHHAPLMYQNARRLERLINQLLDLSRLESGSMHLHARQDDIIPFLRRLTLGFMSNAERERIALSFQAEPDEITAYFDEDKLEKIILNLLSNAFKFTPGGGKIRVNVRTTSTDEVEITVKDTGQGIKPEELPHIFDRFYQADGTLHRRHEGSGIGLSLAKELVELHGGTLEVESEAGFGSMFTIRLPLGRAHLRDEDILEETPDVVPLPVESDLLTWMTRVSDGGINNSRPEEFELTPASAPTVLVIEDNADMRLYLAEILGGLYRVVRACTGAEGLDLARKIKPELVISDIMMPDMDGFLLCQTLKADEKLGHIPVILLTAKGDESSKMEGLELGADDYLTKPFNTDELRMRVKNLLETRRCLRNRFSREIVIRPTDTVVPSSEQVFLDQVREAVERHMDDPNFGVDRLAEEVSMSARQLQRRLKELTELSAAEYIRTLRLERAACLLKQHAGSVSEISWQVGYSSVRSFSQLFRSVYGVPPSEYARQT